MRNGSKKGKQTSIALFTAFLLAAAGLSGCTTASQDGSGAETLETSIIEVDYAAEDLDISWDEKAATKIALSDSGASIDGAGASAAGTTVTINAPGTYVLSGAAADGQVIIASEGSDPVRVVLNGLTLHCSDGPAIYAQQAEKTILTIQGGSTNILSDGAARGAETDSSKTDGAIFCQEDLSINGTGGLDITGNYSHGIVTKDDLVITGGSIVINAKGDGLQGRDSIAVLKGDLTIVAGDDAVKSNNDEDADKGWIALDGGSFSITAGDDGIHAETRLSISSGSIDITGSNEGLEGASIDIAGGSIDIVAKDDGLNAAGENAELAIRISGGAITIDASGDGIDSNGTIHISGGTVLVSGPTRNGDGALDYTGSCAVTGGILAIAGSAGMAQAPTDDSTQNSIAIYYRDVQPAGTLAALLDSDGTQLIAFAPAKDYQAIVFSAPGLTSGQTYTLKAGDAELTKIVIESTVTTISSDGSVVSGNMGMHGAPFDGQIPGNADGGARPEKPEGMKRPEGPPLML